MVTHLALALFLALANDPATAATTQSNADSRQVMEWAERIPRLTMNAESPARYEVEGSVPSMGCRFRVTRVADRASLFIEGLDGTPLLITADQQTLWYDSLKARLVYSPKSEFDFVLRHSGDKFKVNFGARFTSGKKIAASTIDIDVGSFLRNRSLGATINRPSDSSSTIVTSRGENTVLVVELVPAADRVLQRMQVTDLKTAKAAVSIERTMFDTDVHEARLDFPSLLDFRDFEVRTEQPKDEDAARALVEQMIKSLMFRATLHMPEAREQIDKSLTSHEWDALAGAEAQMAQRLRAVPRQGATVPIDTSGQ